MLFCVFFRLLDPHAGGPGQLSFFLIFAQGLAHERGITLQVQQIIHDLKRHAQVKAVFPACLHQCAFRPGQDQPGGQRRGEQRGGLAPVDFLYQANVRLRAFVRHVQGLPRQHPADARRPDDFAQGRESVGMSRSNHHFHRVGQQRVSRQYRQCLAEHHMIGGFAPAHRIVVHGGQIVMNEGIGVDHFQRRGKGQRRFRVSTAQFARCQ